MPKERFARMKHEAREALLNVALEYFAAFGFEGASLNTLLQSLGMSKGAFYHTFHDKEDLYCEVIRMLSIGLPDLLPSKSVDDEGAFWNEVQAKSLSVYTKLMARPEFEALAKDIVGLYSSSRLPARLAQGLETFQSVVFEWVKLGQRLKAIRNDTPASLIARMWIASGAALDTWAAEQEDLGEAMPALLSGLEMMKQMVRPPI